MFEYEVVYPTAIHALSLSQCRAKPMLMDVGGRVKGQFLTHRVSLYFQYNANRVFGRIEWQSIQT